MTLNKYSKYIEYLLITIVLIIGVITSMYKIKHPFWDKQVVSRDYNYFGILSQQQKKQPYILDIPEKFKSSNFCKKQDKQLLITFFNNHFLKSYIHTTELIEWLLL